MFLFLINFTRQRLSLKFSARLHFQFSNSSEISKEIDPPARPNQNNPKRAFLKNQYGHSQIDIYEKQVQEPMNPK